MYMRKRRKKRRMQRSAAACCLGRVVATLGLTLCPRRRRNFEEKLFLDKRAGRGWDAAAGLQKESKLANTTKRLLQMRSPAGSHSPTAHRVLCPSQNRASPACVCVAMVHVRESGVSVGSCVGERLEAWERAAVAATDDALGKRVYPKHPCEPKFLPTAAVGKC